jgi:DMSO/TMAO reductase YedYZ molybdopterin-dependent catalytic subunit
MDEQSRISTVTIEAPANREARSDALGLEITPTDAHFARRHFAVPVASQRVVVGGAVSEPAAFTVDELRSLELRTQPVTLECAGTGRVGMKPLPPGEPWGRGAVSTAVWTGVPLSTLLPRVGLRDDVVEILVRGGDRGTPSGASSEVAYERALPVGQDALLALEMNGEPIPLERGGPIRLIVPGWYGMASVKWVEAIDALTRPFDGWFHTHDYLYDDGPVTTMRVSSRIVAPAGESIRRPGSLRAWGWAWSGHAPIQSVEVSLDAGPWQATHVDPPMAANAWARWQATLEVRRAGRHSLRVRAGDAAGNLQPEAPIWNRLGYGNNVVETIVFTIAD